MAHIPETDFRLALRRAAEIVGSVRKLEREAGLRRGAVSRPLNGGRRSVSIETATAVSHATRGAVKVSDIIPQVLFALGQEVAATPVSGGAESQPGR